MASKTSVELTVQFLRDIFGDLRSDERLLIDVRKPEGVAFNPAHHGIRTYASFDEILDDPWYAKTVGKGEDKVLISEVLDQMYCVTTLINEKVDFLDDDGKLKRTDWPSHTQKWCYRTDFIGFDIDCLRSKAFMTEGALDPKNDQKWEEKPEYILNPDEFLSDIQGNEFVAGWVKSSEAGIQGYIKLEKPSVNPYLKDADKTKGWYTDSGLRKLQAAITYFWGGDMAVSKWGSLMRLPGSYNVKDKYDTRYRVTWKPKQEIEGLSMQELRAKFDGNIHRPPVPVGEAIVRLFSDQWDSGSGCHTKAMAFGGSCAYAGLPQEAAQKLVQLICKSYGDDKPGDRSTAVTTSYEKFARGEQVMGLSSVIPDIAPAVVKILKWWAEYMTAYAKKLGISDKLNVPETGIPEVKKEITGTFYEREGYTWYFASAKKGKGDEDGSAGGPAIFGNWILNLLGYIEVDHEDGGGKKVRVAVGEISVAGGRKTVIKIDSNSTGSFLKFSGTSGIEGLIACQAPTMWSKYITEVMERCPKHIVPHTSFYGVLNLEPTDATGEGASHELGAASGDSAPMEFDEPTFFTPEDQGLDTLLLNTGGVPIPSVDNAFTRKTTTKSEESYLRNFAEAWPNYHDKSFVIPLLGYFCYATTSAWAFKILGARPTLFITGPTNSAKSAVVESLTRHFGIKSAFNQYEKTTSFALGKLMSTSNIHPVLLDEFRDTTERAALKNSLQVTVRGSFDEGKSTSGGKDGRLIESALLNPLVCIGENKYDDAAALDRTHVIEVNRSWVSKVDLMTGEAKATFGRYLGWIEDHQRSRMMSTIIWKWIKANWKEVPWIYEKARAEIEAESETTPRQRKCQTCIYAGMLMLRQIYISYGLKWPMRNAEIKGLIIAADGNEVGRRDNDREALRTLFRTTDYLISSKASMNRFLRGTMFDVLSMETDPKTKEPIDSHLLLFDTNRWYVELKPMFRGETASLQTPHAFEALIKEALTNKDKGIVAINTKHPRFKGANILVDINVVTKLYQVNADQWGSLARDPLGEMQDNGQ